ncbi:Serine/threonine-protein kinase pkn3 [Minicystis rosea]|nr:Serine/threonine-protein kinase pkn3 [Minicystis rosea]
MSSPVNVGDVLASKYKVEHVLGVGGMGVVVAAKHLTLGERVAIKFLLPHALERPDVVARFIREGQASARLKSEHITRVHDVGTLATGAPFLVMEYLDGKDLGAILEAQGPLAVERAIDFVLQSCEALAEAHVAGVIHRDLKPSNLFVIKRVDGSPSIKIIDFGISKLQPTSGDGMEGEMTATAVMMGSPLYMAPEQMASARGVDARADIWSLGVILHTLLTGSPPFLAPTVMGIYEQIVQGAPPIRRLRADVPEGVEAAILKCLQRDRNERFENVGALAEALAPFGPPDARAAAERTKRIVAAHRGSVPPPVAAAPVAASHAPPPSATPTKAGEPAAQPLAQTTKRSAPSARTAPPALPWSMVALALIVACTAFAGYFVLRATSKPVPPVPPSAPTASAAPPGR